MITYKLHTHTHTRTHTHIILSGRQLLSGLCLFFRDSLDDGVCEHVIHPMPSLAEAGLCHWVVAEQVVVSHFKLTSLREHLTDKERRTGSHSDTQ